MSVEPHESLQLSFAKEGNAGARCVLHGSARSRTEHPFARSVPFDVNDVVPGKLFPQPFPHTERKRSDCGEKSGESFETRGQSLTWLVHLIQIIASTNQARPCELRCGRVETMKRARDAIVARAFTS